MDSMHDLVIRNALLVDGLGSPPRRGDLAVKDGKIRETGTASLPGKQTMDADGLALPAVATSGSIDVVAVPEPAVLIYFATGAALFGLRRHHHNRTPRRRTS